MGRLHSVASSCCTCCLINSKERKCWERSQWMSEWRRSREKMDCWHLTLDLFYSSYFLRSVERNDTLTVGINWHFCEWCQKTYNFQKINHQLVENMDSPVDNEDTGSRTQRKAEAWWGARSILPSMHIRPNSGLSHNHSMYSWGDTPRLNIASSTLALTLGQEIRTTLIIVVEI